MKLSWLNQQLLSNQQLLWTNCYYGQPSLLLWTAILKTYFTATPKHQNTLLEFLIGTITSKF